jgi:hypothetical protein
MKISFLVGGAVGYVLGSKAGRERYESIVRLGRTLASSQTMQSSAGVLQGQVDTLAHKARETVTALLRPDAPQHGTSDSNGYRR